MKYAFFACLVTTAFTSSLFTRTLRCEELVKASEIVSVWDKSPCPPTSVQFRYSSPEFTAAVPEGTRGPGGLTPVDGKLVIPARVEQFGLSFLSPTRIRLDNLSTGDKSNIIDDKSVYLRTQKLPDPEDSHLSSVLIHPSSDSVIRMLGVANKILFWLDPKSTDQGREMVFMQDKNFPVTSSKQHGEIVAVEFEKAAFEFAKRYNWRPVTIKWLNKGEIRAIETFDYSGEPGFPKLVSWASIVITSGERADLRVDSISGKVSLSDIQIVLPENCVITDTMKSTRVTTVRENGREAVLNKEEALANTSFHDKLENKLNRTKAK